MPAKVYLQPVPLAKKSVIHTAYVGDGPIHPEGHTGQIYRLQFYKGVAQNVDEKLYRRMKEAGIADTGKPALDEDEE